MTQTIRKDFIKKDWEKDYTSDERREIIKNNLAFIIIQSIKDKNSPLLKASTYKELAGVDSEGNIDNSNIAFNGFNGVLMMESICYYLILQKKQMDFLQIFG